MTMREFIHNLLVMKAEDPTLRHKTQIFKALGHPTRLKLVKMLSDGERCVCELVAEFNCSQAAISKHLDVLVKAGVLHRRREGVKTLYSLAMPCLFEAMECIERALRKGK